MRNAFLAVLLLIGATVQTLCAETIKIGVAQTVIENHLSRNRDKLLDLMARAKAEGCHLVIFPENALYWAGIAAHRPSQAELDAAIEQIRLKARSEQMYVVFGGTRKLAQKDAYHNTAVAYGPRGRRLMFYNKNMEVPQRFYVRGVPVSVGGMEATTAGPSCAGFAIGPGHRGPAPTSSSPTPCTTIPTSWATAPGEAAARS
ncbi:MAG: nitrilase-related carbon-nitrogen hydrolase [Planctomycetota bacterium]